MCQSRDIGLDSLYCGKGRKFEVFGLHPNRTMPTHKNRHTETHTVTHSHKPTHTGEYSDESHQLQNDFIDTFYEDSTSAVGNTWFCVPSLIQ